MAQVPHPDTWFMSTFGQVAALTAVLGQLPGVSPEIIRAARRIIDEMHPVDSQDYLWNAKAAEAARRTLDRIADMAGHREAAA